MGRNGSEVFGHERVPRRLYAYRLADTAHVAGPIAGDVQRPEQAWPRAAHRGDGVDHRHGGGLAGCALRIADLDREAGIALDLDAVDEVEGTVGFLPVLAGAPGHRIDMLD